MLNRFAIVIALASCGDNLSPPDSVPVGDGDGEIQVRTYGDAEFVWTDAWCQYAERCKPDVFSLNWDSQLDCAVDNQADNCAFREASGLTPCEHPYYRILLDDLRQCHDEMANIECTATRAPDSCYAAFEEQQ